MLRIKDGRFAALKPNPATEIMVLPLSTSALSPPIIGKLMRSGF
jgi:hypothetical protein